MAYAPRPPARRPRYVLRTLIGIATAIAALAALDRLIPSLLAEDLPKADAVLVDKAQARLSLVRNGEPYRAYPVALGAHPQGHKQRQGDGRTPEGNYVLDYRMADSRFYKAIHLSYPNAQDQAQAATRGDDPGGVIMIHGQPNGFAWLGWLIQRSDWTNGCIAVGTVAMEEIWRAVDDGTPIEIRP